MGILSFLSFSSTSNLTLRIDSSSECKYRFMRLGTPYHLRLLDGPMANIFFRKDDIIKIALYPIGSAPLRLKMPMTTPMKLAPVQSSRDNSSTMENMASRPTRPKVSMRILLRAMLVEMTRNFANQIDGLRCRYEMLQATIPANQGGKASDKR
ncbi:hypothetical protein BJ165DRAFT_438015 [Panaeolus papilionaceus]|nr:hypothetical protein BJ165DRAFT_438015 [Panaeolus papilionaceus]